MVDYKQDKFSKEHNLPGKYIYLTIHCLFTLFVEKDLGLNEEIEISTWEVIKGEDYLAQKKEKTNEDLVKRLKMTEEK